MPKIASPSWSLRIWEGEGARTRKIVTDNEPNVQKMDAIKDKQPGFSPSCSLPGLPFGGWNVGDPGFLSEMRFVISLFLDMFGSRIP